MPGCAEVAGGAVVKLPGLTGQIKDPVSCIACIDTMKRLGRTSSCAPHAPVPHMCHEHYLATAAAEHSRTAGGQGRQTVSVILAPVDQDLMSRLEALLPWLAAM